MARRIKKISYFLLLSCTFGFINNAAAELDSERKQECRKPRFRSIDPPDKSELTPGSEFSFTLPVWADPERLVVIVKKLKPEVTIEDRNSFFVVKVKLPEELVDTYARVDVIAYAELGCTKNRGWLYKISGARTESAAVPEESTTEIDRSTQGADEKPAIKAE